MSAVTTVVITDPDLLARLAATDGPIAFCGPDGAFVRFANPAPRGKLPAGVRPPITDEEFEKLRQQPDGRPLAEVWKRIHERYGS
ncbi:MAG TPA: hypothetical protein VD866_03410 [Urbifossiella sp.]|nr:hypothetical protein [Urbifossiella sp.]